MDRYDGRDGHASPERIMELVELECRGAKYIPLGQVLGPFLLRPYQWMINWDYALEPRTYPVWVIAELHPRKPGLLLAYSECGHGAYGNRWGILTEGHDWFGRDDSWYLMLKDAAIAADLWEGPLPEEYEVR